MATILSAPFENGLTGGLAWDALNNGGSITKDTTTSRHGASSMLVTGNASFSIFGSKTISQTIVNGSVYFRYASLPSGVTLLIRGLHPTRTPGISISPLGKLQGHIGATDAAAQTSILSANTWYLIDYLFDTSTTTFTVDFKVSDTNGVLIDTSVQTSIGGQTAAAMTALIHGQCASVALTCNFDDAEANTTSAAYPIGPHTSVDGTFPAISDYPPSWIDDSTLITGGKLFGLMAQNTGSGDNGQAVLSEGATKANRTNLIHQTFYGNVNTTGVLTFEGQIADGSLLGHQGWPMIHPFGFGSTTVGWPAAGLAHFTDGSLDTVLDAWITVLNSKLPNTPFLIRMFREMTNNVTIYGRNGSTVGGLNETTSSFIAAWRHIVTYIRASCSMARFVWCPDTNTAPSDTINWYPGDSYVDWIGVDAYGTTANSYDPSPALTTWHDAYKPNGGSLGSTKPIMVCETSIQKVDPDRIVDFQAYTSIFTILDQFKVVGFWDSATTGPYYVSDSPVGFLTAFQDVVSSFPFTGRPNPLYAIYTDGVDLYVAAA